MEQQSKSLMEKLPQGGIINESSNPNSVGAETGCNNEGHISPEDESEAAVTKDRNGEESMPTSPTNADGGSVTNESELQYDKQRNDIPTTTEHHTNEHEDSKPAALNSLKESQNGGGKMPIPNVQEATATSPRQLSSAAKDRSVRDQTSSVPPRRVNPRPPILLPVHPPNSQPVKRVNPPILPRIPVYGYPPPHPNAPPSQQGIPFSTHGRALTQGGSSSVAQDGSATVAQDGNSAFAQGSNGSNPGDVDAQDTGIGVQRTTGGLWEKIGIHPQFTRQHYATSIAPVPFLHPVPHAQHRTDLPSKRRSLKSSLNNASLPQQKVQLPAPKKPPPLAVPGIPKESMASTQIPRNAPVPHSAQISRSTQMPHIKIHKYVPEKDEKEELLQPVAKELDGYYLCDDEILVEEDPLPPELRGLVEEGSTKKLARPQPSSLLIHPIPPRTVGGLQDQVHAKVLMCTCKRARQGNSKGGSSVCLTLYCECFATGDYCSAKCRCCASCFNNAAETSVQPRTQAIVELLKRDPNAFRHAPGSIAQRQKEHRIRLVKARANAKATDQKKPVVLLSGSKRIAERPAATKRPTKQMAYDMCDDPNALPPVEVLTTQLPPSYYAVPLKVHQGSTVLTGLSFTLTHPRHRTKQSTPNKKPPTNTNRVLGTANEGNRKDSEYRNQEPSTIQGPEQNELNIGETQIASNWRTETDKTSVFFQAMRAQVHAAQKPWSWFPFEKLQKEAATSFDSLADDIESIKNSVAAAKIEMMARLYQENRLKRGYAVESEVNIQDTKGGGRSARNEDRGSRKLLCDESLESSENNLQSAGNDINKFKDLTILAAQDTALLQETSRIIRRMARELCERRIHSQKQQTQDTV